ncbi:hypothetical protein [Bradyrhizobium algeriense]|uniref:hypothetical protein n=1 Tax=Bradyrhizobium algeriense TaxID=634784 RepID=UPI001FCF1D31|nr:hypothetical protein [Bradyrhizobium algeriense]
MSEERPERFNGDLRPHPKIVRSEVIPRRLSARGYSYPEPCYGGAMTKEQVKAVLDRVLTWPSERQEDAAKVLMLMESQNESVYRLTDEQVEEVRRRRADPNARKLTLEEFNERLRRRLGE